jgi:hypothetical protein
VPVKGEVPVKRDKRVFVLGAHRLPQLASVRDAVFTVSPAQIRLKWRREFPVSALRPGEIDVIMGCLRHTVGAVSTQRSKTMPKQKIDLKKMAEKLEQAAPVYCLFAVRESPRYEKVLLEEELPAGPVVFKYIKMWRGAYPPHEGWQLIRKHYEEGQSWIRDNDPEAEWNL